MLLKGENLVKSFGGTVAVNDVNLEVNEGEILSIIGPNGAGKSVLFSLISGSGKPTSGSIKFAGEEIAGLSANQISRKGIARTFQLTALFEKLPVVAQSGAGILQMHDERILGSAFTYAAVEKR